MFLWDWLNYWLILGAWQVYQYYKHYLSTELRLERLEKSFSEARLNAAVHGFAGNHHPTLAPPTLRLTLAER